MNKVECIIIEDEKPAQVVLKSLISRVDWLDLKETFDDALAGLEYLKSHDVDLIFLDIQIPSLSGIDFMKVLKNPPQVIITSAYSQYALEAFDLDVRDYLMKPIAFERFLKAVQRITPRPDPQKLSQLHEENNGKKSFAFFNMNKTMVRVDYENILYVESMREYVYIHTDNNKVVTKLGIGEMEKLLTNSFARIHRSFIVNVNKITAYNAEEIFINKISLPIGTNYKKLMESVLNKL